MSTYPARLPKGPGRPPDKALIVRDLLWLYQLSHGRTAKQLSWKLTEQGIKNRLIKIRQRLHVKTTTEAVAEALRRGLIQ